MNEEKRLRIIIAGDFNVIIDKSDASIARKVRNAKEEDIPVLLLGEREIKEMKHIGYIRSWEGTTCQQCGSIEKVEFSYEFGKIFLCYDCVHKKANQLAKRKNW